MRTHNEVRKNLVLAQTAMYVMETLYNQNKPIKPDQWRRLQEYVDNAFVLLREPQDVE